MGLFDALAKQAMGGLFGSGQQADMLGDMFRQAGGLEGLRDRFKEAGLEETFMSWVGIGANRPVLVDQLKSVLGPEALQNLTSQVGMNAAMVLPLLSQFLPQIIDKLTPNGSIEQSMPSSEQLKTAFASVMDQGLGGFFGNKG